MRKEKRSKAKAFFFWAFMLLAISMLGYIIFQMKFGGIAQCLSNPINYGLAQFDKFYNTTSTATVSINKEGYASWIATANRNEPIQTYSGEERIVPNFNLSSLKP